MESLMQGPSLLSCFGGGIGISVQDTRGRSMALHSSSSSSSSTSPFSSSSSSSTSYSSSSDPYGDGAGACKLPASSFSYGRLQTLHEEEEEDDDEEGGGGNDGNVGEAGEEYECDEWMMLDMARWRRRHVAPEEQEEVQEAMAMAATAALLLREQEEEEEEEEEEIAGKSKGRLGLGVVVRSRLKSSTRLVAAKIKRLLIAAHEGSPHVAHLFLNNHLLVHQLTGSCLSPPPP